MLVSCADSVQLPFAPFLSMHREKVLEGCAVTVNHASLDAAYLHLELKIDGDKTMVIMY